MIDRLIGLGINILFVIGGDGSMRGAQGIVDAAARRNIELAVVGVPKTIDNDIPFLDHSFGFQTAFSMAKDAIRAAYIEATAVPNGVGLVKLMGRHSGFIASYAALANNDADFVLIPEVDFKLEGPDGLLASVRKRVTEQGHAVVVAAEGAGQQLLQRSSTATDASGNARLHDIGQLLRQRITDNFAAAEHSADAALSRPELRDPQRAGQRLRRDLLRAARPRRRACRDGRPHRHGGRTLAWPVRAPADPAGHRQPQPGRPER